MVHFKAVIKKFNEQGEKPGWSYIEVPEEVASKIKPGCKKSFRVKGYLDKYRFQSISLLPMGDGNFIMPLNATIRKNIRKQRGAMVQVKMEIDARQMETPAWMTA